LPPDRHPHSFRASPADGDEDADRSRHRGALHKRHRQGQRDRRQGQRHHGRSIEASTEIYEQRLLITGLFDDKAIYDDFEKKVRAVSGVKKLYWHAVYMRKDDQAKANVPGWVEITTIATKAQARPVVTMGVAGVKNAVNYVEVGP
jgi:hypothetical protein